MSCSYFVVTVPGAAHRRYHLGSFNRSGVFIVHRIAASRPDGVEIERPTRVEQQLAQAVASDPAPVRPAFHNAPIEALDRGRARAIALARRRRLK